MREENILVRKEAKGEYNSALLEPDFVVDRQAKIVECILLKKECKVVDNWITCPDLHELVSEWEKNIGNHFGSGLFLISLCQ